jgi:hypothetical protein
LPQKGLHVGRPRLLRVRRQGCECRRLAAPKRLLLLVLVRGGMRRESWSGRAMRLTADQGLLLITYFLHTLRALSSPDLAQMLGGHLEQCMWAPACGMDIIPCKGQLLAARRANDPDRFCIV